MRVANLSFRYGRQDPWVLSDVALAFAQGEVAEVVGPNGTGKSTLLRLLAGLLRPVKGAIDDRPQVVGYGPERFPAAQPFTVAAYLRHMAAVRGVNPQVVGEWSERLGMDHLLGQRLPDLSKGSAHKVGLAQALLCEPGLLILDEPFAGLDAATRAELPRIIGEVSARGGITVVSDHQGDLRRFPGLRRYEVRDASVRQLPHADGPAVDGLTSHPCDTATRELGTRPDQPIGNGRERTVDPAADGHALHADDAAVDGHARRTVLEVDVPASEAAALADRLRTEGYPVRIAREDVHESPAIHERAE